MVQPIDLIFCKMVEIIEQNIFNRADFYLVPNFLFLTIQYFQLMTSPVLNLEILYKMQIQRKCHFSFIVWMSLTKLYKPSDTALRQLFNGQLLYEFVFCLRMRRWPQTAL